MRLVAIAKDRAGAEDFAALIPEIYFDSETGGYPFFSLTNGRSQGLAQVIGSYLFGGQVAKNMKNVDQKIPMNFEGKAGSVLGSVIVVDPTGKILYHHKEKVVGDQPDSVKLKAAIKQLGEMGVAACECDEDLVKLGERNEKLREILDLGEKGKLKGKLWYVDKDSITTPWSAVQQLPPG